MGYCANAGYIKGHNGYFNPYDSVTGYEVLAMVLRAVGYDQNHEFEGAAWQTNVSALSTQLGILKQVKSTHYGDRLYEASRRDVVASLLFETAANVPMVNYSEIAGYNKYQNLIDKTENDTLGYKNFGLKNDTRIIVGNQDTGESCTYLGPDMKPMEYKGDTSKLTKTIDVSYDYPGTLIQKTNAVFGGDQPADDLVVPDGIKLDWKSDLGLFGHKVKVWYDAKDTGDKKTYAVFDKAELAATVKVTADGSLEDVLTDGTDDGKIGLAAANAGFTKGSAADTVYISDSFSRIGGGDDGITTAANVTDGITDLGTKVPGNTSTVVVLVSNNKDKTVDVVIPVVMQIGQVNHVNNQINKAKTFTIGSDTITMQDNPAVLQSYVMNPEQIKLSSTVVVTEVTARTDNPTAAKPKVYWLNTPYKTVTGTVTAYDWDGTTNGTQKVTLDDGTVLKRTIVADANLASGLVNVKNNTGTGATKLLDHAKYEFLLDMQGNWINAKRIYDNNFIYGTYLDYVTSLGTSTFTNRIVGVDMDGKMVTYDITKYNLDGTNTYKLDGDATNGIPEKVGIPYRGSYNDATAATHTLVPRDTTKTSPVYHGFIVNGDIINGSVTELEKVAGIQSFGTDTGLVGTDFVADIDAAGDLVIDKDTLKLGVAKVKESGAVNLYLTEDTKFIVVNKDGYGTDTLKPTVYNGLTESLGSSNSVEINAAATAAAGVGALLTEIEYTSSPYIYANTGATARQVNTIIIPETALTRVGATGLTYFPTATNVVDAGGTGAQLFTAYHVSASDKM